MIEVSPIVSHKAKEYLTTALVVQSPGIKWIKGRFDPIAPMPGIHKFEYLGFGYTINSTGGQPFRIVREYRVDIDDDDEETEVKISLLTPEDQLSLELEGISASALEEELAEF